MGRDRIGVPSGGMWNLVRRRAGHVRAQGTRVATGYQDEMLAK